jgi:hypothetical protein
MDRRELINDSEESLRMAFEGMQAKMWTAMPAIVQTVNLTAMTLTAIPSILGILTDKEGEVSYVEMPLLVDVPIMFMNGGGFITTYPIEAGDEALIIFGNRCIDTWWQSGGVQVPAEYRMHDLSDGFALVGPRSQARLISGISNNSVQMRNDAGTIFCEVSDTVARLVNGTTTITATAATADVVSTTATVTATNINLVGTVNITGAFNVNGKNVGDTHTHSGVQVGAGNTGGVN